MSTLTSYQLQFTYYTDVNAFETVMKFLFGFKFVEVSIKQLIQVCSLVLALDIDNEDDFQDFLKKEVLSRITEDNILEAYQMAIDLSEKKIETTCFEYIKRIGFTNIFSDTNIYKLNEKAFCGLMNLHSFEKKKIVSEDDFNKKMLLDAKTLIEIIKRYCEENFKESNLRKEKMISFIKDFYVAHQSEPIENVDQLFFKRKF